VNALKRLQKGEFRSVKDELYQAAQCLKLQTCKWVGEQDALSCFFTTTRRLPRTREYKFQRQVTQAVGKNSLALLFGCHVLMSQMLRSGSQGIGCDPTCNCITLCPSGDLQRSWQAEGVNPHLLAHSHIKGLQTESLLFPALSGSKV